MDQAGRNPGDDADENVLSRGPGRPKSEWRVRAEAAEAKVVDLERRLKFLNGIVFEKRVETVDYTAISSASKMLVEMPKAFQNVLQIPRGLVSQRFIERCTEAVVNQWPKMGRSALRRVVEGGYLGACTPFRAIPTTCIWRVRTAVQLMDMLETMVYYDRYVSPTEEKNNGEKVENRSMEPEGAGV